MKKVILLGDVHLDHTRRSHPSYNLTKQFVKYENPDAIYLTGDILDMNYVSEFDKDNEKDREGKRFDLDMDILQQEIEFFKSCSKRVFFLQGNHEERCDRHIQKNPNLLTKHLDLSLKMDIPFTRQINQPVRVLDSKLVVMHDNGAKGKYKAANAVAYYPNSISGHHHQIQDFIFRDYKEVRAAWIHGSLCDLNPEYAKGKPNMWQNGFAVVYIHDRGGIHKNFSLYNIHIVEGSFIFNNKEWRI